MRSLEGRFAYNNSNAGRLDPISSGYTDCSGLTYFVYNQKTGYMIGEVEDTQAKRGNVIVNIKRGERFPIELMKPGDVICTYRDAGMTHYDHAALYMGNNEVWDQSTSWPGGDWTKGPHLRTADCEYGLWDSMSQNKYGAVVVRFLE